MRNFLDLHGLDPVAGFGVSLRVPLADGVDGLHALDDLSEDACRPSSQGVAV
jgi:hypothetical protein